MSTVGPRGVLLTLLEQDGDVPTLRAKLAASAKRRASPGRSDSSDKLLHQIEGLSPAYVKTVSITPSLMQTFECKDGCSACCYLKLTIDYLPDEFQDLPRDVQSKFSERVVRNKLIFTSHEGETDTCQFLSAFRPGGGLGCSLYPRQSLSCVSAPQLQFIRYAKTSETRIMKKAFGRGWNMPVCPQCIFTKGKPRIDPSDLALLRRFEKWANYFEIDTLIPEILDVLEWLKDDPRSFKSSIRFDTQTRKVLRG